MKCPCRNKNGVLVDRNLSNQSNPSIPNFNPKYYWAQKNPNWRYQQKVQYNPSGNFYLSNLNVYQTYLSLTKYSCKNKAGENKYPTQYCQSFETMLREKKAMNINQYINRIFF